MADETTEPDGVFRFDILVNGQRQRYEFDPDRDKFMGSEAELIERHAGRVIDWWHRIETGAEKATAVDLLLVVFIAANRAQLAAHGSSLLQWDEFIATVAPFTLRPVGDDADEPTPIAPAARRSRGATGRPTSKPAARKTTPKTAKPETTETG
jgi:hypothetical protein